MENYLPFEIDEMTFDHQLIHYKKPLSTILACAVKNEYIIQHLGMLSGIALEPTIVTVDAMNLPNALYLNSETKYPDHFAILHMGHRHSSISFIQKKRVHSIRTLFFGGYHLQQLIKKNLDLTTDQAAEVLHTHGVMELKNKPLYSDDLKKLSSHLQTGFDSVLNQLKQSLALHIASNQEEDNEPLSKLYLSGGCSEIKNIAPWLSHHMNIPCEKLNILSHDEDMSEHLQGKETLFNLSLIHI